MDEKAADLVSRFEAEIEKVRKTAAAERDHLRAETTRLETKIMDAAKADVAKILEEGRAKIDAETATLRKELEANRPALAQQIATKLLGREVAS